MKFKKNDMKKKSPMVKYYMICFNNVSNIIFLGEYIQCTTDDEDDDSIEADENDENNENNENDEINETGNNDEQDLAQYVGVEDAIKREVDIEQNPTAKSTPLTTGKLQIGIARKYDDQGEQNKSNKKKCVSIHGIRNLLSKPLMNFSF